MGKIIAIEGIDGCGKQTLSEGLQARLLSTGKTSTVMSFPTYSDRPYGKAVSQYLKGGFGPRAQTSPYMVGLLYAGDRLEAKAHLEGASLRYDYLLLDRYYASSRVYQGLQLPTVDQQQFCNWMDQVEFQSHGIPKPDCTILLDLPAEDAAERMASRASKDIHEIDLEFLNQVRYLYLDYSLSQKGWFVVSASKSIESVVNEAFQIITAL